MDKKKQYFWQSNCQYQQESKLGCEQCFLCKLLQLSVKFHSYYNKDGSAHSKYKG